MVCLDSGVDGLVRIDRTLSRLQQNDRLTFTVVAAAAEFDSIDDCITRRRSQHPHIPPHTAA